MIRCGSNPNQVALTFDDGPSEWTLPLLDILDKHGVLATFFVLGKHVVDRPGTLEAIRSRGHEVGNHSYDHLCLGDYPEATVQEQILKAQEVIGGELHLFRPPYGRLAQTPVEDIAAKMGYRTVMWSVMPGDWASKSSGEIVDEVMKAICKGEKGEIILLHDGGPEAGADRHLTLESVDEILTMFPDKQFVTISDLDE